MRTRDIISPGVYGIELADRTCLVNIVRSRRHPSPRSMEWGGVFVGQMNGTASRLPDRLSPLAAWGPIVAAVVASSH